ncbi:extensin-like domain-containing protein [Devosia sediminis]|uniref:Extensin family protein n=1 Tax=Devosia sediminis TaxID=2798801 RepID=A0A934J196_9HYPH|nr:extensin family protein [Devosia sediminis]MBJ3785930.1 extensin family protein [Devosia sediminis]
MRLTSFTLIALLSASTPALAQDFFESFGRFVEDALPRPAQGGGQSGPVRPTPPSVAQPVAPTVPTPAVERPDADAAVEEAEEPPLPRPRPEEAVPEPAAPPVAEEPEPVAVEAEPERIYQTACPALLDGSVMGEMLEPIAEGICGERSPLSITAVRVNGREIGFSAPVTTNCEMAGALADWVGEVDAYAAAALESPVATLDTGTSMMCRNRNGGDEGFVSEHGFANAVDVIGVSLADGRRISVEADWQKATSLEGKLLRQAHGAACGRFTTVLGPEANAEHADHLHLDLGCHGQTCTARICE